MEDETYSPFLKRTEKIPVQKYLESSQEERRGIKSTRIVPPRFDGPLECFVEVEFKTPHYDLSRVFR
ncbi:MAG: hypothetical protein WCK90_04740 [archaeon]